MPKVSVIIPVFGVEHCIRKCAISLFDQTLDDIEYVFVDDCSPDKSIGVLTDLIDEYACKLKDSSKKVVIKKTEINSGQAIARRVGIESCTGDYFIICDSDDYVDTDLYERMWKQAVSTNADIVKCDLKFVIGDTIRKDDFSIRQIQSKSTFISSVLCSDGGFSSTCDKLVRRSLILENDILYPSHPMNEDRAFLVQLAYFAKSISYVGGTGYYYVDNPNSITRKRNLSSCLSKFYQSVDNLMIIECFMERHSILEDYDEALCSLRHCIRYNIAQYTHIKYVYDIWMSTFPDLNHKILRNKYITKKEKFKFILTVLRIYPLLVRVKYCFG